MSKQSLLLVDGDTRSLRVLEVSLRKAGFMVTAALSVQDALDKLDLHAPDLIISETAFADGDGFELRRRVRATPEWSEIPFIFLTAEAAIEDKIRGLELGVDDYLTKPIYIKEIVTRINILLQKRQRVRFEERRDGRTRFAGRVLDMPVVDVIQTIEISRKSGVIQFVGERGRQAAIYFRDGRVIDAEAGSLVGEDAVYRLLTWSEGEFEVVFRTVRRREVITMSSQALLMEGMRRLDEWSRLFEQLPPLTHRFEVDTTEFASRLGDVPDDNNRILRLFDGKRTLLEVIDASDVGDLECLQAISRLYFEELLLDLDHDIAPRRDTGKALPLIEFDEAMAMREGASAPVSAKPSHGNSGAGAVDGAGAEAVEDAGSATSAKPDAASSVATGEPGRARAATAPGGAAAARSMTGGGGSLGRGRARVVTGGTGPASAAEDAPTTSEVRAGPAAARTTREMASGARSTIRGAPWTGAASRALATGAAPSAVGSRTTTGGASLVGTGRATPAGDSELAVAGGVTEAGSVAGSGAAPDPSEAEAGPLAGGYRPSSLRLIDEAVAAAQAIEPSLFDDSADRVRPEDLPRRGNGVARAAGKSGEGPVQAAAPEGGASARAAGREESGLRMIGSLGRDRAEASGELAPLGTARPRRSETARELVTILPRRSTRELATVPAMVTMPAVTPVPPQDLADSLPLPKPAFPVLESTPATAPALEIPPDQQPPAPPRVTLPGTGVRAPGRSRRILRILRSIERTGPGLGPLLLILLAAVLAGTAVLLRVRRHARVAEQVELSYESPRSAASRAIEAWAIAPDAMDVAGAKDAGLAAGANELVDAGATGVDAGARKVDAAPRTRDSARSAGASDKIAEAKVLFDRAHDALEEGDFERALELADASLKQRRTARTYLLRAQAQQRLDRVDDALGSIDAATKLAPEFGTVWELRGRILWAARRRDEARAAFEKFLELDPESPKAPSVRRLMNEPR